MPPIVKEAFAALDQYLANRVEKPLFSLSPQRELIVPFIDNAPFVQAACGNTDISLAIAAQFEKILAALLENFPENLFWDVDYLLGYMANHAAAQREPLKAVRYLGEKITSLLALFGEKSAIRFRYIHDFTYGFDWAKWVKKDPENRKDAAPFSPMFLQYLDQRGHELLQLIEENDRKYHQLEGKAHRNPFIFSREPEDESRLLRCLAADGHIPVPTWELAAVPRWSPPFADIRRKCSQQLGIQQNE